jgi:5-formyltetrahydrofolate cyclo-ligase
MSPETSQPSNQQIRQLIRQARRAIPPEEQIQSSSHICHQLAHSQVFQQSRHIAFYLAADGEISLQALLEIAAESGRQCYLPVSRKDGSFELLFYPFSPGDALNKTSLGVLEPARQEQPITAQALDLVLTPLVAFDDRCFRMGMGKGFYDRTFAFRIEGSKQSDTGNPQTGPKLVGVAHGCQKTERLAAEWWDVPLDAIITPEAQFGDTSLFKSMT